MANMYKIVGSGFLSRGTKFSGLDLKRVYFVSLALVMSSVAMAYGSRASAVYTSEESS